MQPVNSLENLQAGIKGKFCYSPVAFLLLPYGVGKMYVWCMPGVGMV